MNWKPWTMLIILLAVLLGYFTQGPKNSCKSDGFVKSEFRWIRETFDEMLSHEKEGLAMAAYVNGELVIDLWGGYADKNAMRLWERDTMMVAFSASKAIGALIIAILVSLEHLRYEDKVVKFWPEFGAHGKDNITVQWIIEHKAGLSTFDGELSIEKAHDHRYVSKLIENTKPKWPPGTAIKYHAITYGWLLDQLIRRVDPAKRGIGQFYREEIQAHMKEKDFDLGSPRHQYHRVARIVQPTTVDKIVAVCTNSLYASLLWKVIFSGGKCEMCEACSYPLWMSVISDRMPYNNPAVQEVENTAALGIGTARGLANVISTIWQKKMISEKVWKEIRQPGKDLNNEIIGLYPAGHGFFYDQHPVHKNYYTMSHAGHGMQMLTFDPHSKVVLVLLRNGLLLDTHEMEKTQALFRRIVKFVENKA